MHGFKSRLKSVLSDAVSNFQDSGDPNDACIKAANAAGFNADQADRLVETFNTARVICNYKNAEDKAGSCSLADKEAVHAGLVAQPSSEKSASAVTYSGYDYVDPDRDYFMSPSVKAAEAIVLDDGTPSRESLDRVALRHAESLRQLAKTAEEEARAARDLARETVIKLASALSRNVSISDVHDRVARIVAAYASDDRYSAAVEKLAEALPDTSDPGVDLLDRHCMSHVVDTTGISEFVPALKEASDLLAHASALDAFAGDTETDARMVMSRLVSGVKQADTSLAPTISADSIQEAVEESYKREFDRRKNKALADINNLQRKLVLQDLLLRDKILSQEDPQVVMDAYKSIHQISPDATLNKDILRAMLRQAVNSVAISAYDANTLAGLAKARRQAYDPNVSART